MVYVDDMRAEFRGMKMCHMIADYHDELVAMADRIGVARRWIQKAGTPDEHFDICSSKRILAVKYGAQQITWMELGRMTILRRRAAACPEKTQLVESISSHIHSAGHFSDAEKMRIIARLWATEIPVLYDCLAHFQNETAGVA